MALVDTNYIDRFVEKAIAPCKYTRHYDYATANYVYRIYYGEKSMDVELSSLLDIHHQFDVPMAMHNHLLTIRTLVMMP